MLKKIFATLCLLILVGALTACGGDEDHPEGTIVGTSLDLLQAGLPQDGDTVVTLHTSMGDIIIRLFPKEAPMAYVNFVTHAMNGYYDGTIFHRVIQGFMIQGGDPLGTGFGGESIWGHGFGPEYSPNLRHFRGALAMAQSQMPNSIGSQFYIVQSFFLDDEMYLEFRFALENQDMLLGENHVGDRIYVSNVVSEDMANAYLAFGGTPRLDLAMNQSGHTVFGQVTTGMNVVDTISAVERNENDRPSEDVVINSVTVTGTRLFEMSPDDLLEELLREG